MRQVDLPGKNEVAVFGESCDHIMQKSCADSVISLRPINSNFVTHSLSSSPHIADRNNYGNLEHTSVTVLQVMPMPDNKVLIEYLIHKENEP